MASHGTPFSRRQVLRSGVAASGLVVAGTGVAAGDETVEVNVGYDRESGRRAAEDEAEEVHRRFNFDALTITTSEEGADRLRRRGDIRYVEENGTWEAHQTLPWGVDRVGADVAHSNGETGASADVAIIDTGIDDDHPDLLTNVGEGKAYVDCRGRNCNYPWSDDNDHGTHCAGIADAVDNAEGVVGVSTEATLHALKVLDDSGSGYWSDVAAAIEYTADQGWDVGSMSLGASSGSQTVRDACQYAYERGVLLVASAGNDGPCTDCVGYPAAYDTVVAVSSTDEDDTLSSFSSTGPEVELAAPGGSVYSTVIDGYGTMSGTSMACPHVSGAGAHLMADGYTNTEARQRLKDTAEDLGLSSDEQGAGLLDAEAAVLDGDDGDANSAPACSVVDPADGDTVAGTVTVRVDASDEEDDDASLDVEVAIDGGTWRTASYDTESGYYEYDWDTTAVDDGDRTVDARATDSDGATTDADGVSVTVENDDGSGGDAAPTIERFDLTDASNPRWARVEVDWAVSDGDGDLAEVTTVLDGGADSETSSVGGSSASGTHKLRDRNGHGEAEVTLTVTDAAGNETSETGTVRLG